MSPPIARCSLTLRRADNDLNADYCEDRQRTQGKEEMNRFLRAGENGGLLTDCRELSPYHTASSPSSSTSSSSISITSSSSSSAAGSADRHAALPSLQTRGPGSGGGSEPRRSAFKRSRAGREGREEPEAAAADRSAAAVAVRGCGELCVGVGKQQQQQQQQQRREAQGRSVGGEGLEMISALSRDAEGGGGGERQQQQRRLRSDHGLSRDLRQRQGGEEGEERDPGLEEGEGPGEGQGLRRSSSPDAEGEARRWLVSSSLRLPPVVRPARASSVPRRPRTLPLRRAGLQDHGR